VIGGYGHVAECHERLLKGDGLDHQIPDYRVDRLSAFNGKRNSGSGAHWVSATSRYL